MTDEKLEVRTVETQREPYEKPTLAKHGELRDLTAGGAGGYPAGALGCTKLFI